MTQLRLKSPLMRLKRTLRRLMTRKTKRSLTSPRKDLKLNQRLKTKRKKKLRKLSRSPLPMTF